MVSTIGPDLAHAAVSLRKCHPQAPALEVLDLVMRERAGSLADFGDVKRPGSEFGAVIADAFDTGMAPQDWNLAVHPNSPRAFVMALLQVWETEVCPSLRTDTGSSYESQTLRPVVVARLIKGGQREHVKSVFSFLPP